MIFDTILNFFNSLNFICGIFLIFKRRIPDATVNEIDQSVETIAQTAAQASTANASAQNVRADEQGESWLQRNWRPILMVLFIAIIANNTFGLAYFHAKEIGMTTDTSVVALLRRELKF